MPNCLLMIENAREAQVLKLGFEQAGIQTILSKANYKNYTLALQYVPDFLVMEMPRICMEQMHITGMLRKHRRFRGVPIIGYGGQVDEAIERGMIKAGISVYMPRPLKFSAMLDLIAKLLKPNKKTTVIVQKAGDEKDKDRDYAAIKNPETPSPVKLDIMARYVSRLMAFPFTIAKVLQITNDEKSGAAHLAQAITIDPTIAANILKVANSVFFVSSNRRINSIKEAIVRIGFQETKKIVMGMMVFKLFDANTGNQGFNRIDFWYHSLAAGLFAERIAKFIHGLNTEMAFLAGLLHDLGVIILDEYFPEMVEAALKETCERGGHFPERETALFGINHNDLIARLFPLWKIPDGITEAITNHCGFMENASSMETDAEKLTFCVMLGNLLAKTAYYGQGCDQFVWPVENWAFESAHIGAVITDTLFDDVYGSIEAFRRFLDLEPRDYAIDLKSPEKNVEVRIGIVNAANHLFIPAECYFRRKGYTVERILEADTKEVHERKRFSAIVVWAGSAAPSAETLAPYCCFVKYGKTPIEGGGKIEMAPLLLLTPPGCNAAALPPEIVVMENRFDLRELDMNMEKLFSGVFAGGRPLAAG